MPRPEQCEEKDTLKSVQLSRLPEGNYEEKDYERVALLSFDDCFVNTLKQTMIRRLPDCRFTAKDHAHLAATTPLTRAQIDVWAENFHYRIKSPVQREAYLKDIENEKVSLHFRTHVLLGASN
jgi:hypothetical protein